MGEQAGRRPVIYFDPAWYREAYGLAAGVSPLAHYLVHRRGQGYAPNALFDPAWYIAHSATPVHRNRDPFTHFLIAGMHQDVRPSPAFDVCDAGRAMDRATMRAIARNVVRRRRATWSSSTENR